MVRWSFASPDEVVQFLERNAPPMAVTKQALPKERYAAARDEMVALFRRANQAEKGCAIDNEYLLVVARKQG
jgi:hypothetical protein